MEMIFIIHYGSTWNVAGATKKMSFKYNFK